MGALDEIRSEMTKLANDSSFSGEAKNFEDRMLNFSKGYASEDDFSFDDEEDVDPVANEVDSYLVGEPIPINYNTDEEIEIGDVVDVYGKLSAKVDEIMQQASTTVLPFAATGVLPQVVQFKEHDIFTLNGTRYVMSRQIRKPVMEQFKNTISETLKSGLPYTKVLMIDIIVGTESYESLLLDQAEWSYLCSLFRRYNARVFQDKYGQLVLKVG